MREQASVGFGFLFSVFSTSCYYDYEIAAGSCLKELNETTPKKIQKIFIFKYSEIVLVSEIPLTIANLLFAVHGPRSVLHIV